MYLWKHFFIVLYCSSQVKFLLCFGFPCITSRCPCRSSWVAFPFFQRLQNPLFSFTEFHLSVQSGWWSSLLARPAAHGHDWWRQKLVCELPIWCCRNEDEWFSFTFRFSGSLGCLQDSASLYSAQSTGRGWQRNQRSERRGLRDHWWSASVHNCSPVCKQSEMIMAAMFLYLALYFQSLLSTWEPYSFSAFRKGIKKGK